MIKGKLRVLQHGVMFWCKGCNKHRVVNLDSAYSPVTWSFNGDYEKPTISPSILVRYPCGEDWHEEVCHSFVTDGEIQYLDDCTHELAGKIIEMEDVIL